MFDSEDNLARKAGWLVLSPGEAYEMQFSKNSGVYIFKNGTTWIVWRVSWSPGDPKPKSEKTLATTRTFEQAFERAQSYVNWRRGQ